MELHVTSIHCISRADILPFEVSDAARSEEEIKEAEAAGELKARVSQDVRLNGRYIDLRTAANQAIFKVQSGVCQVWTCAFFFNVVEILISSVHAHYQDSGCAPVVQLDTAGSVTA